MKCIKDEDWRNCRRLLVMWPFVSACPSNRGRNKGEMVFRGISAPLVMERGLPAYPCSKQHLGCLFFFDVLFQVPPSTGTLSSGLQPLGVVRRVCSSYFSQKSQFFTPNLPWIILNMELSSGEFRLDMYSTLFGSSPYWHRNSPSNSLK